MNSQSFLSPYIKIECADRPRFILRKPEKAFSIVAPDWDARIKAVLKTFQGAEVELGGALRKRVKATARDLDRNYAKLQAHYQAAYLQFASDPCGKKSNEALARGNEHIRTMEFKLREIEIGIARFVRRPPIPSSLVPREGEIRSRARKIAGRPRRERPRPRKARIGVEGLVARAPPLDYGYIEKLVSEFRAP